MTRRERLGAPLRTLLFIFSALPATAVAQGQTSTALEPTRAFAQLGFAASNTEAIVAGLAWDWGKRWDFAGGLFTGYWEASLGRWSTRGENGRDSAWVTQFGVTPVLRYAPSDESRYYFEAGIGANFMSPLYRSNDKRFSTTFNFGDHLALGMRFGERGRHEIALRLQHFSNAGIREPNPGEDFVQLRYAVRLD